MSTLLPSHRTLTTGFSGNKSPAQAWNIIEAYLQLYNQRTAKRLLKMLLTGTTAGSKSSQRRSAASQAQMIEFCQSTIGFIRAVSIAAKHNSEFDIAFGQLVQKTEKQSQNNQKRLLLLKKALKNQKNAQKTQKPRKRS